MNTFLRPIRLALFLLVGLFFCPAKGQSVATLVSLGISEENLSPIFSADTFSYFTHFPNQVSQITLLPIPTDTAASVSVQVNRSARKPVVYTPVPLGVSFPLEVGDNEIEIRVSAANGFRLTAYTIRVVRQTLPDIQVTDELHPFTYYPDSTDGLVDDQGMVYFGANDVESGGITKTFTIKNKGDSYIGAEPLTGLTLSKGTTGNPEDFVLGPLNRPYAPDPKTTTLLSQQTTTFTVTFRPKALGERTATILVGSNDPDENPFQIHLSGQGRLSVPQDIVVFDGLLADPAKERSDNQGVIRFFDTPEAHDYGAHIFTIKNTGSFPLTGLTLGKKTEGNPDNFRLTYHGPATLAPHESTTFTISFGPTSPGEKTATVIITSNDPDESPFELHVAGLGTAQYYPPNLNVYQTNYAYPSKALASGVDAIPFGLIPVGGTGVRKTFSINNYAPTSTLGNLLAKISLSADGHPEDFVVSPLWNNPLDPPYLLQWGAIVNFEISFRPTGPGLRTSTLLIESNDPDQPSFEIHLSGNGFALGDSPPLIITEINYNPPGNSEEPDLKTEFIEVKNVSNLTLDLVAGDFEIKSEHYNLFTYRQVGNQAPDLMAPGEIRVYARNSADFAARYPEVPIHGGLRQDLSHTSERLRLNYGNVTLFSVTYGSETPWPSLPDGTGFTLVSAKPNENPDPKAPLSWRTSTFLYGSPGADDPPLPLSPVVINELKTRDDTAKDSDVFELANLSDAPVDISGWFLSDSSKNLRKFRIPAGTVMAPRGFLTFTQAQLGFGISGAGNDEFMLFAADAKGTFTGYKHSALPGPSADQRSFIRVVSSDGREFFPPSQTTTLGAANSPAYTGSVVFSEINFQPAVDPSAIVRSEYIELTNRSEHPVNLFEDLGAQGVQPWKIQGIAGRTTSAGVLTPIFHFPPNLTLGPGELVLLIPATSYYSDVDAEAAISQMVSNFRLTNKIPSSVTKIYPFYHLPQYNPDYAFRGIPSDGDFLSDNSQPLILLRPALYPKSAKTTELVFMTEDRVHYRDDGVWPNRSSGDGPGYLSRSLVRANPDGFGGEPASWDSSPSHGGTPGYAANFSPPGVVISEVLAHSNLANPERPARTDFIELKNTTAQPVAIGGWWLSSSSDKLARAYDKRLATPGYVLTEADSIYEIPAGTTIPAGGFWSVNSDDDDNPLTAPPAGFFGRFFTLNSRGDSVRLVAMDATRRMSGYVSKTDFDATENAVSLARFANSEGRATYLPATAITTEFNPVTAFPAGAPNAAPAVPGVVISEIMYAAPPGGFEFVELYNRTGVGIALYDNFNEIPGNTFSPRHNPDRGWLIPNLNFTFPSTPGNRPVLESGEVILLTNAATEAAFRAFYPATPSSTRIFLWGSASLPKGGKRLKLQKPDAEDVVNGVTLVPAINVDELNYASQAPWPATGFAGGYSLERRSTAAIADDAANWRRSSGLLGTPGRTFSTLGNGAPTASPDQWLVTKDTVLSVAAPGVLANDTDVDPAFVFTARLVTPPPASEGTLVFRADGSFTFTPVAGFQGRTSFAYQVTDAATPGQEPALALTSEPATVSLLINRAPQAVDDAYETNEDTPLTTTSPGVLGNDLTPDPGSLLSVVLATPPPASTGALNLTRHGYFTFTPAADFHGTTSFSYRVTDGLLTSAPATVSITVKPVNDAPVARPDTYFVKRGQTLTIPAAQGVLVNDTDGDGDTLTAAINYSSYQEIRVFLRADGSLEITTSEAVGGYFVFSYAVYDQNSSNTFSNFTIFVENDGDKDGLDDTWETSFFASLDTNPNDDPDGDGLSNFVEFAFGTDPRNPSPGPLTLNFSFQSGTPVAQMFTSSAGDDFRGIFCRRKYLAVGLVYTVQFSADLSTWENSNAEPEVIADSGDIQAVAVTAPAVLSNGKPPSFFRVVLSLAP